MQILAHLYSISSHYATAAIHPGNQLLPSLHSSFFLSFLFSSFFIGHHSFLSILFNGMFSLSYVFISIYYPFITPPTTTLPTSISPTPYFIIIPLYFYLSGCTEGIKQRCCASHYARQQTLTHCQRVLKSVQ